MIRSVAMVASSICVAAIGFASTAHCAPAANLPVTDQVRGELVQTGAALLGLPAAAFTGLDAGDTYYAYDPDSQTYWAAAGLTPSANSYQAQVSTQDDGSYLLFTKPTGQAWRAYRDGLGGQQGATCPVQLPAAVLALWQWSAASCFPPIRH
ncbi:MAG: hypothetical protein WCE30_18965 [Mycobacterium sp.]